MAEDLRLWYHVKTVSSSDFAFDIKVLKVSPSLKYDILSKLKKQVFYLGR